MALWRNRATQSDWNMREAQCGQKCKFNSHLFSHGQKWFREVMVVSWVYVMQLLMVNNKRNHLSCENAEKFLILNNLPQEEFVLYWVFISTLLNISWAFFFSLVHHFFLFIINATVCWILVLLSYCCFHSKHFKHVTMTVILVLLYWPLTETVSCPCLTVSLKNSWFGRE